MCLLSVVNPGPGDSRASQVGWGGVGESQVSSRCSELGTISNLLIVYFWNFPFTFFWTMVDGG